MLMPVYGSSTQLFSTNLGIVTVVKQTIVENYAHTYPQELFKVHTLKARYLQFYLVRLSCSRWLSRMRYRHNSCLPVASGYRS